MKKCFTLLLIGFAFLLFKPDITFAQSDTLDIGVADAFNISNVINGDTLAGGVIKTPNRVYRLQRGLIYQLDATITVRGSFKMIATAGTGRPPVLVPKILADNSSIVNYIDLYGATSQVEFNDIYFLGIRQDGELSNNANSGITVRDSAMSLKVRRCVFDSYGLRCIAVAEAGVWSKIDVQDSKFRNGITPGGSWLYGQAFKTQGNLFPLDTVKFINNTFIAFSSYIFGVSGWVNYALFDHNTIIYGIGNTFLCAYNTNVHITNNIVYSAFVNAGYKQAVYGDWFYPRPDTVSSSVIVVNIPDTVAFRASEFITPGLSYVLSLVNPHGVTVDMIDDHNRVLEVNHNAYFYPDKLMNFINTYNDTVQALTAISLPLGQGFYFPKNTLAPPRWMNDYTESILTTKLPIVSPLVSIDQNTTYNADPQFNDTDAMDHIDSVIVRLAEILTDNISAWRWTYKLTYPPAWPLPEDLAYANTTLQTASAGGFPLGDLNWFPSKKAEWEVWVTDVKEDINTAAPLDYELQQNYPNPFNPTTGIKFSIAEAGLVTLKVYDILGREVATLVNQELNSGNFSIQFNASNLASGTYIYQLNVNGTRISKKMMFLK